MLRILKAKSAPFKVLGFKIYFFFPGVRTSLLESEDSECPDCKEKNCSPGSLIPNRFLRNSVNVFKNETGYTLTSFKSGKKYK